MNIRRMVTPDYVFALLGDFGYGDNFKYYCEILLPDALKVAKKFNGDREEALNYLDSLMTIIRSSKFSSKAGD